MNQFLFSSNYSHNPSILTLPGVGSEGKEETDHLTVTHDRGGVERTPARPGLFIGEPGRVTQDDVDHGLVTLTRGAVQHTQTILVLVQEAGSPGQENLHHLRVTLLHCTPQWRGSILTLGLNILANLHQQLGHLSETCNGSVVQGAVAKLVSLKEIFEIFFNKLEFTFPIFLLCFLMYSRSEL